MKKKKEKRRKRMRVKRRERQACEEKISIRAEPIYRQM
jgi:hypothetical protein